MGNNDLGEHSRKTRNDNENGEERPFKKAKYVWQLKGKYHLKESYKQPNDSNTKESCSKDVIEEDQATDDTAIANNNNLKNKNCNKCCLDTLLARSNALLENEDPSDLEVSSSNIDRSIHDEIPVTLVKPNLKNQDDYLSKWQARQVAKCYVDNTINSILEQWKLAPVDAADFVENCDNDGHVEDEGILMAIQSHGLQSGSKNLTETSYQMLGETSRECNVSPSLFESTYLEESALDNYENVCYESRRNAEQEMTCDSDLEKGDAYEMSDHMDFLSAAVSRKWKYDQTEALAETRDILNTLLLHIKMRERDVITWNDGDTQLDNFDKRTKDETKDVETKEKSQNKITP
ncbi:hypothetical protein Trydic_g6208 [Trypoxylus dichotomus]